MHLFIDAVDNFKMHIAHLTSVHPRYDTRIFSKECRSLAEHGFRVTLIVADGKSDEMNSQVRILDVGASRGRLDRIINTPKRLLAKALAIEADIYHLHDPELLPIGIVLKKIGKRVVFDMHENLDLQILQKKWIPWFLRKPLSIIYHNYEKFALKKMDRLVVPQISMKKRFENIVKTEVIGNFPNNYIENSKAIEERNKHKILYAGLICEPRGIINMLNLITELKKISQAYTLTLAGPIDSKLLRKIKNHQAWPLVNYKGILSAKELYDEYQKHSIGLILFNNVGQYFMAYSLKLFEYMQSGMLVIMPNFGDWNNFNRQYGAGYCIDIKNANSIAKAIDAIDDEVLNQTSARNMMTIKENFLWETQLEKLFYMYHQIKESSK